MVLPPSSSSKPTCSGWCTSPTKWARNIRLSVRLSGLSISACVWMFRDHRISVLPAESEHYLALCFADKLT
ncbi:Os01g0128250 [Oryza sativa Japonica Group]|uniref:Os01g0128250 protein n=1 Tax=Oryza sativa subsp. japonica TaxID=39947 RepID=A0A0P0UXU0_ORYSJ|nr:hypothetical protein EE612_000047 [Oryza sativa]BAS70194.1 Os01g0128250 [Oryza sativa Japonica Group]